MYTCVTLLCVLTKRNLKYCGQKYASTDVQKQFLSSPLEVSETHSCYNFSSVFLRACVVHALCMRESVRICSGQKSTFVHGFQNNLAKLFSQRSSSAIRNVCSGSLEVKVTLEGQMIKWLLQIQFGACACMHCACACLASSGP